jgi:hypothetical protein
MMMVTSGMGGGSKFKESFGEVVQSLVAGLVYYDFEHLVFGIGTHYSKDPRVFKKFLQCNSPS